MTRVQAIVEKIIAQLGADAAGPIAKPDGLALTEYRQRPTESSQLPLTSVFPVRDDDDTEEHGRGFGMTKRKLRVFVLIRATGSDLDAEPIRAWVHQQVMADVSVGGLATNVQEAETDWTPEQDSQFDYSAPGMAYEVSYTRKRNSLE